ncbi:MAG: hypothetical protein J6Q65_02215 [Lentisphaeria bacterium]|nr:hypothetical protein [Lentisphaeria bacterium]
MEIKPKFDALKVSLQLLFPDPGKEPFTAGLMQLTDGEWERTLNRLAAVRTPFRKRLDHALLTALAELCPELDMNDFETGDGAFFLRHARNVAECFVDLVPRLLEQIPDADRKIRPSAAGLTSHGSVFLKLKAPAIVIECRKAVQSRICRFEQGKLVPVTISKIRPVDDFYGYRAARQIFLEHFGAFAAGKSNLPLLISSLPGLGKTQMTISHCMHYPEITLILATPAALDKDLEILIRTLEKTPDKRFMVFFDDIDVPQMDWYNFRTFVGGAFPLPENISFTIAANQTYPANISSRGRGFAFPIFDELRCQEMIEDFLTANGIRQPSGDLISVIAADYVEQFGQKMFEELSPRTLVRYLEQFAADNAKKRRMLDSSWQDVIPHPDPQVFYDENLKLMRAVYGEEIIEKIRNRELGLA